MPARVPPGDPPSHVFFYGTLMAGFARRRGAGVDAHLRFVGRGSIPAALFDLGLYPAAVPSPDGRVWGELYEVSSSEHVLPVLDTIEGYTPAHPEGSLYLRDTAWVTSLDGSETPAWVYFYNAPLGRALPIASGDYLAYVQRR